MDPELTQVCQLAIGRILRLGSRPYQEGDIEEYERCRAIIMDAAAGTDTEYVFYAPNWARDRRTGARGD